MQREEGRGKGEEGRGKREEGRGKREEGRGEEGRGKGEGGRGKGEEGRGKGEEGRGKREGGRGKGGEGRGERGEGRGRAEEGKGLGWGAYKKSEWSLDFRIPNLRYASMQAQILAKSPLLIIYWDSLISQPPDPDDKFLLVYFWDQSASPTVYHCPYIPASSLEVL